MSHIVSPQTNTTSFNVYYRVPPGNLDSRTTITIGDKTFDVEADDLELICDLGRGAYGVVEKMKHIPSGTIMAVKVGVLISFWFESVLYVFNLKKILFMIFVGIYFLFCS